MKIRSRAIGIGAAAALAVGGLVATASPAAAYIECVPYSETTGSCIQRNDDGTTIIFFYWGDHWVEYQLQ